MPTYQYACKDCGNQFEQVQAFSDPSLTTCPTCSGSLRKVYGSVGVVFKGSGFYRTDSRSGSSSATLAPGAKADGSSAADASSSGKAPAASTPTSPAAKVAATSGSSTPAKAAS